MVRAVSPANPPVRRPVSQRLGKARNRPPRRLRTRLRPDSLDSRQRAVRAEAPVARADSASSGLIPWRT